MKTALFGVVLGLALSSVFAEAVQADPVSAATTASSFEFTQDQIDSALQKAYESGHPLVIVFGSPSNGDVKSLGSTVLPSVDDAVFVFADTGSLPAGSALADYASKHQLKAGSAHTAVFVVTLDGSGSPSLGKTVMTTWGVRGDTASLLSQQVKLASRQMPQVPPASSVGTGVQDSATAPDTSKDKPSTSSAQDATTAPVVSGSGNGVGVDPATEDNGNSGDTSVVDPPASDEPEVVASALTEPDVDKLRVSLIASAKAAGVDMTRFEGRLDEFDARCKKLGLSLEQRAKAYSNIAGLLDSKSNGPYFDSAERVRLAELVLHNLARPTSIDQGNHPTCNVTTLEVYMAARHPEVYSDMVRQVALTGKCTTVSGDVVNPPKASLMPGDDETNFDIDKPSHNKRNHASQIVQMTLINGVYESGRYHSTNSSGKKVDCTGWRYVMGPPVKSTFPVPGGYAVVIDEDKLIDENGKQVKDQSGKPSTSPIFIGGDVLSASEMALGYKMPYLDSPYMVQGKPWVYDLPTKERLFKLKSDGKFPLGVPTYGGSHVQTIHDVVEKNGTVWILIDNQRGEKEDGWITLTELHGTQKSGNFKFTTRKEIP